MHIKLIIKFILFSFLILILNGCANGKLGKSTLQNLANVGKQRKTQGSVAPQGKLGMHMEKLGKRREKLGKRMEKLGK